MIVKTEKGRFITYPDRIGPFDPLKAEASTSVKCAVEGERRGNGQTERETDGLAGNWGSNKMRRSGGHMDRLKIVQRETPWLCLPAVLAGFQAPSVTLSISALL